LRAKAVPWALSPEEAQTLAKEYEFAKSFASRDEFSLEAEAAVKQMAKNDRSPHGTGGGHVSYWHCLPASRAICRVRLRFRSYCRRYTMITTLELTPPAVDSFPPE
jgi:hypothetical protein